MPQVHDSYFTAGLDSDPELAEFIRGEPRRQQEGIELIASENIVSRLVLESSGLGTDEQNSRGIALWPLLRWRRIC